MQMANDNAIQRKLEYDENKRREAQEALEYELEKKKRLERAMKAPVKNPLASSHEQAKEKIKQKQMKLKEEEEKKKEIELLQEQQKKKKIQSTYNRSKTDKDIQYLQEAERKRKETKERRKIVMLQSSSVPGSSGRLAKSCDEFVRTSAAHKNGTLQREYELNAQRARSRTPNPEEVVERLRRQKALWDAKISKQKEENTLRQSINASQSLPKELQSMARRQQEMEKKKADAIAARKHKALQKEREKKEEERLYLEKLKNLPLPPAGINNAARLRAEKVHAMLEKRRQEEEAEEERRKQSLRQEKLQARLTMYELAQYDEERREAMAGQYVELFKIDEITAEKARNTQRAARERHKINQGNIKEKLAARPSLVTRQAQDQAAQAAKIAALSRIAESTKGLMSDKKGGLDSTIYTDEERIRIGALSDI
eukprot:CAMPEP_0182424464 /NCGR_PEP_ID=MMETSP1167-20130531/10675_1 /TAXON_ID=2988 /ORGANISM="Mallomonas Sp, Strain CCMP3275" /LENGTH=426 /DNA_ID=CAMNT_0024604299 /DNA_START=29 /DNA_END=1309 /DNA_ORIENTATION=+